MRNRSAIIRTVVTTMLVTVMNGPVLAGMPALLPSDWTADNPASHTTIETTSPIVGWQVQALSFFLACLFVGAVAVQWLWNHARRDFPVLPQISYRRSLSLVVMWGLLFVVVLTMISGARELMTPGAWRKQGWTYQLEKSAAMADTTLAANRDARRGSLEQLRTALWLYAATHGGKFPARDQAGFDARLWDIPGHPGLQFLSVPDRSAEETGRLLIFEPQIDGDDRLVLLTNGLIGSMRTEEIRLATERRDHLVETHTAEGGQ